MTSFSEIWDFNLEEIPTALPMPATPSFGQFNGRKVTVVTGENPLPNAIVYTVPTLISYDFYIRDFFTSLTNSFITGFTQKKLLTKGNLYNKAKVLIDKTLAEEEKLTPDQGKALHAAAMIFCNMAADCYHTYAQTFEKSVLDRFFWLFFSKILNTSPTSYLSLAWIQASLKLLPQGFFGIDSDIATHFLSEKYTKVCEMCLEKLKKPKLNNNERHETLSLFIVSKALDLKNFDSSSIRKELAPYVTENIVIWELVDHIARNTSPAVIKESYEILYSFISIKCSGKGIYVPGILYGYYLRTLIQNTPLNKTIIMGDIICKFKSLIPNVTGHKRAASISLPASKVAKTTEQSYVNAKQAFNTLFQEILLVNSFCKDAPPAHYNFIHYPIHETVKDLSCSFEAEAELKILWNKTFHYFLQNNCSPIEYLQELINPSQPRPQDSAECLIQTTFLETVMEWDGKDSGALFPETEEQKFLRQAFWREDWEIICEYANSDSEIGQKFELQSYWIAAEIQQKNYNWGVQDELSMQLVLMDLKSWQYVVASQPQVDQLVLCLKGNYPLNPQPGFFKDCNLELAYQKVAISHGYFYRAYLQALYPARMRYYLGKLDLMRNSTIQAPTASKVPISQLPNIESKQIQYPALVFRHYRPVHKVLNIAELKNYLSRSIEDIFYKTDFFTPKSNVLKTKPESLALDLNQIEPWSNLEQGKELFEVASNFCNEVIHYYLHYLSKYGTELLHRFLHSFFGIILNHSIHSYFSLAWMRASLKLFNQGFFGDPHLAKKFFAKTYTEVCDLCIAKLSRGSLQPEERREALSLFMISRFLLKRDSFEHSINVNLSPYIAPEESRLITGFVNSMIKNIPIDSRTEKQLLFPILSAFVNFNTREQSLFSSHPILYLYYLGKLEPNIGQEKQAIVQAVLGEFRRAHS